MTAPTIPAPRLEATPAPPPECWICNGPLVAFMKDCDRDACRDVQAAINAADKRADDA